MLFNTIEFIIFFIVAVTILVAVKNKKFQHVFLLLASYFFFYYTSNYLIVLLIFTTVWDYYFAQIVYKTKDQKIRKTIFAISLAGNLGLLAFFKYADFAIAQFNFLGNELNLNAHIPMLDLALPIGISFYTFHSMGYMIDVYRKQVVPSKSLREYAIFITFFPQLVSGPILRAREFLPQLREKMEDFEKCIKLRQIVVNQTNLKIGVTLMALGFFKKMFFADNISPLVNDIFANSLGLDSFTIILGTIGFGIQVYGDFSGYSDIAIGAALVLGFKIPANFNKPFFATSPSDFWRRWHISLSSWVRDYLFLPIVYRKIGSDLVLAGGLMVTFIVLGLWHGAGWNFIVFGFLHGIYVTVETLIRKRSPALADHWFFKKRIGKIFSILTTQYLIFLAFIAFRVQDIDNMLFAMQKFVFLDFQTKIITETIVEYKFSVVLMILFVILHLVSFKQRNLPEKIASYKSVYWILFLVVIITLILLFNSGNPEDFIYFKF